MRNFFSEQEDNYLKFAHERQYPLAKMAEDLARPYGSICTRRRALGLKYDDRPAYGPRERVIQYNSRPSEDTVDSQEYSSADYAMFILTGLLVFIALSSLVGGS